MPALAMWNQILVLVFAAICAAEDYRSRKVSMSVLLLFALIGGVMSFLLKRKPDEIIGALVPGFLITMLSFASSGCVGMGDALFLIVGGLYQNSSIIIQNVLITWGLASLIALIIVVKCQLTNCKRKPGGIPFITLMTLVMIINRNGFG